MKPDSPFLLVALLLASVSTGLCQPVITTQPSSLTNIAGTTATFSVEATGTEPLHYQWQFNTLERTDQTNAILVLTNVQTEIAGSYTVAITNVDGAVTSAGYSGGDTWGDFNNDGFLDLFVFNGQEGRADVPSLYRNERDGTFTKVTSGPPVNDVTEPFSACWGDYDNDGNLDLFLATS